MSVKPEKNIVKFLKYFVKYFMKYFTKYFKAKNFMKFYITSDDRENSETSANHLHIYSVKCRTICLTLSTTCRRKTWRPLQAQQDHESDKGKIMKVITSQLLFYMTKSSIILSIL